MSFEFTAIREKKCIKCHVVKQAEENFSSHPSAKDGFYGICKACVKVKNNKYRLENSERLTKYNKDRWQDPVYRERNDKRKKELWSDLEYRTKYLEDQRNRRYGITNNIFNKLLESQDYKCALCLSKDTGHKYDKWCVDHDHKCCPGKKSCGKCVRGLLCSKCNMSLGGFNDNIEILKLAIKYLEGGSK